MKRTLIMRQKLRQEAKSSICCRIWRGMNRAPCNQRLHKDSRIWQGSPGEFIGFIDQFILEKFKHVTLKIRDSLSKRGCFAFHLHIFEAGKKALIRCV